jgi:prolyl-tRNA editing enzyme YbaK/EbsC (Cys-tRNA(Pro) deacylase)
MTVDIGSRRYAAWVVLATTRADVNGIVRKHLGARKISFARMDTAVSLTGMDYGGITPIGLPADWPILVDSNVVDRQRVIIDRAPKCWRSPRTPRRKRSPCRSDWATDLWRC